jgi:hypothetical protein
LTAPEVDLGHDRLSVLRGTGEAQLVAQFIKRLLAAGLEGALHGAVSFGGLDVFSIRIWTSGLLRVLQVLSSGV